MGWEQRGRHFYFYRTVRRRGRVRKWYLGRTPVALFMAQLYGSRRAELREWRALRTRLAGLQRELSQLNAGVATLLAGVLYALGFHRPGRHRWRLRKSPFLFFDAASAAILDPPAAAGDIVSIADGLVLDLRHVVKRAQSGDWKVLPKLAQLLEDRGDIWEYFWEFGQRLERDWLALLAAGQPVEVVEFVKQQRQARWEEMGPFTLRLERLLAQRAMANWMAGQFFEQALHLAEGKPSGRFLKRCFTTAERSQALALKALAELQRLLPRIRRVSTRRCSYIA